jgi:DedD protein
MDEGAKRRFVGAAVLVALAVIFVPMLIDDKETDGLGEPIVIPDEPDFDAAYDTSVEPAEPDLTPPLPIPEPPADAAPDIGQGTADMASPASSRPAAEPVAEPVPERAAEPATAASPTPSAPRARPSPTQQSAAGPKPVPPGTAAWVIQVASLGSPEAAQTLQDSLRGKGYPAFVEQARVNGKLYYRVRVGPEVDRARADRTAAKLQGETGTKPLVQSYR